MGDNNEHFTLEDGRVAEKIVTENRINDQEHQRIIEIKAEEKRPLKTQQRITEKTKSYLYERVTETLDQNTGAVVDTKVETFDCISGDLSNSNVLNASSNITKKLNTLSNLEDLNNIEQKRKYNIKDILLTTVIVAQILGLIYLLFWAK